MKRIKSIENSDSASKGNEVIAAGSKSTITEDTTIPKKTAEETERSRLAKIRGRAKVSNFNN